MFFNSAGACIIGRKRQLPCAKLVKHLSKIPRAAFKVLPRIIYINTQGVRRAWHQLRKTRRPLVGQRPDIPTAFLLNKTKEQIFRHVVFPGRRFRDLQKLAFVVAGKSWNDVCCCALAALGRKAFRIGVLRGKPAIEQFETGIFRR